ncbi:MAG: DUF1572 family protein [Gemmatimonadetes bacterium]|nr:DUF1572 family protein [Gemmatimonadota bacterium]
MSTTGVGPDALGAKFIERCRYYLGEEYPAKIRAVLEVIPDEALWWRPNIWSNSVGNLVLHLCGNVRQWVVSGIGGVTDVRKRDEEFAAREGYSAEELRGILDETIREVEATLAALPVDELMKQRLIQGRDTLVMSALFHVVEHFSTHTGQIVWLGKMWSGAGSIRFYDDANNAAPLFLGPGRSDIQ